jgi:hypothetical protein
VRLGACTSRTSRWWMVVVVVVVVVVAVVVDLLVLFKLFLCSVPCLFSLPLLLYIPYIPCILYILYIPCILSIPCIPYVLYFILVSMRPLWVSSGRSRSVFLVSSFGWHMVRSATMAAPNTTTTTSGRVGCSRVSMPRWSMVWLLLNLLLLLQAIILLLVVLCQQRTTVWQFGRCNVGQRASCGYCPVVKNDQGAEAVCV